MTFPQPILSPAAVSLSGVTTSTWTTITAANSGAPAGATGFAYEIFSGGGAFVRETRTGPADSPTDNYVADSQGVNQRTLRFCKLDNNGAFQYYTTNTTPTADTLYPLIWFGPEVTFFVSIVAMPTLTTAFVTTGTSGNCPGGIAAVLNIHGGSDNGAWFRHPSSTDNYVNSGNEGGGRRDYFTALDGTQSYAGRCNTAGRQPYLVCFWTSGFSLCNGSVNATARTPGVTGSYQNLATTGDTGPIACLYQIYNSASSGPAGYQLSGQGTSWADTAGQPSGKFSAPALAYSPTQCNIPGATFNVYEIGYLTQAGSYALHSNLEF